MASCIRTLTATPGKWLMRGRTRRHLQKLDARSLRDVGVQEEDRRRECAKWFWRA